MIWTDERIAKSGNSMLSKPQREYAAETMRKMRDEYEASIAELEAEHVNLFSVIDRLNFFSAMKDDRIAELDAKIALLISSLKRSGVSYVELVDRSNVVFRENCELIGRIAELEEGGESCCGQMKRL